MPKPTTPIEAEIVEMRKVVEYLEQLAFPLRDCVETEGQGQGQGQRTNPHSIYEKTLSIFSKPLYDEHKFRELVRSASTGSINNTSNVEKFFFVALEEGARRQTKGAQVLNGIVTTCRKLEQRCDALDRRINKLNEENNAFVDSAIDELNETTKETRKFLLETKRRNVQDVPVFSEPRRKKKKSEFVYDKPASSFLAGHSNFTLYEYLPPRITAQGNTQTIPTVTTHKKRQ